MLLYIAALSLAALSPAFADKGDRLYKQGRKALVARDYAKALPLLEAATAEGSIPAWKTLAENYFYGWSGTVDYSKVVHYALPAAEAGDMGAMRLLFKIYTDARHPETYSKESAIRIATVVYKIPSTKENKEPALMAAEAALLLHSYDSKENNGGPKGPDDAFAYLLAKKSALEDCTEGMEVLQFFYRYGIGTTQNKDAAIAWCKKAIDWGNSQKCIYALAELTGTKPVFRADDYRAREALQKEREAHPERQLTKADLGGSAPTSEETKAYDAWWEKTYGSGRQQSGNRPAATTQWGTPEKTARERDQEMYDKMHKEQDAREKSYNEKWGR
jgi:TPR repeat protein